MFASAPTPDALLRRLEWTVVRPLQGLLQGDHRSLFRGSGIDLAKIREYQEGDDIRYIDWNVSARSPELHVREYQEDRELTAWFLLDLSPSVDFASDAVSKRMVLAEFVAVMGRMLTGKGNYCGALLFSGAVDCVVPPRSGRRQVLHLLDLLASRPRLGSAPQTDLGAILRRAANIIRRRSVLFVVSDFISKAGWESPLGALARRHEVVAIRLTDPAETHIPDMGLLCFQDAESGEQILVDTGDFGFRRRFTLAAQQRQAAQRSALARAGVDCLELSTEDDLLDALVGFVQMRKTRFQRRMGGASATDAVHSPQPAVGDGR
jgi:uncharacterized protein (DUF58 family)